MSQSTIAASPSRLSPPPPTRALALAAAGFATGLLLLVAVLGGAASMAASPSSGEHTIISVLSVIGLILTGIVLWRAIRAIVRSVTAARLIREDEVLEARTVAAESRQDALLTFGLGVFIIIGLAAVAMMTMNDGSIQKTFFRWDLIQESAGQVIRAFGLNIWIAVVAEVFVLIFGLILAIGRMVPGRAGRPVRVLAVFYIDVMRAVPAIIVLYLVGFGLPLVDIPILSDLPPVWYAIIALTLTYSAYTAETYRAGIDSIHPSQWSAARSIGFSYVATLRFVVLPQAVRLVIPPLMSIFIGLQKDTSLVNTIGAMDAFNTAKFFASTNFNLSAVTVVAVIFTIFTIPQTRLVDTLLARGNARRKRGK